MKSVRTLPLNYHTIIRTVLPKDLNILGLCAQVTESSSTIKPYLVYLHDSLFPQVSPITLFLARGQVDLEHDDIKSFDECLGLTFDSNRRTNNIATLWRVTEKIPQEIVAPRPPPPRIDYSTPESRAAIEAAKKREEHKSALLAALEEDSMAQSEVPLDVES